jgi:hypothetical protein
MLVNKTFQVFVRSEKLTMKITSTIAVDLTTRSLSVFGVPGFSLSKSHLIRSIGAVPTICLRDTPGWRVCSPGTTFGHWKFARQGPFRTSSVGPDCASTSLDTAATCMDEPTGPLNWPEYFMDYLETVSKDPLGSFATTQRLKDVPFLFPMLSVEGVGSVPMPLLDPFVEQLKSVARKAPFGVGSETHFDDDVRNCWEIDASKVSVLKNSEAQEYFAMAVQECCYQLGISKESFEERKIRANLYKMLLYEKGGHFLPHRDGEKEDGMFGTLILQLPSVFSGGGLTVKHDGKTKNFYHEKDSASSVHAMAFYADCEHTVHQVRSGRRLCLVYNLVADSVEQCPSYSVNKNVEAELFRIANYWRRHRAERKLGYPLAHSYSQKNFSFTSMKGDDAHVLTTLANAKCPRERPIFDVWLVLMERYISRDALDAETYHRGRDSYEEIRVLKVLDREGAEMKVKVEDEPYWKMILRPDSWMVSEADFDEYLTENGIKVFNAGEYEEDEYSEENEMESDAGEYEENNDGVSFNLRSLAFAFEPTEHVAGVAFIGNNGVPEELWYHAGAIVISPK